MTGTEDVNKFLKEVYTPAFEKQLKESPLWDGSILPTKLTRRTRIKYWFRRVRSNIKDAWWCLWHGPDKWMDY
jgi:hypothetical protein